MTEKPGSKSLVCDLGRAVWRDEKTMYRRRACSLSGATTESVKKKYVAKGLLDTVLRRSWCEEC